MTLNRTIKLAARPVGLPKDSDWNLTEEEARDPGPDEVLVKVLYLSLDPAMRGWMADTPSYIPPVGIGETMRAIGVGRVVASNLADLAEGDHVSSLLGVQEYATVAGAALQKVDPSVAPLPVWLSTLGMPGMTAYFGLLDVGRPQEGETVVISGAAGAVGSLVGQIAKIKGARAVGIAGGPEKCSYVTDELGFDACIDYKAGSVADGLAQHCPDKIDVYFDNVGGDILDAALAKLARHARVVICGAISQYNNESGAMVGPANYMSLLVNHASMTGFVFSDYLDRLPEGAADMGKWFAAGEVKTREDVVPGLENFPATLLKLYSGENNGKLVLEVAPE
ncbi:MAG: NADP-dependent oxidoreductase [Thermoleophilaceae bacterium]|nr:NADP-dependent oxidoreductase [Thermoleophilaceae bacterium]